MLWSTLSSNEEFLELHLVPPVNTDEFTSEYRKSDFRLNSLLVGVLEKVVLCLEDKATGRKLERFVWEVDFDMAASPGLSATGSRVMTEPRNQEELEDALRQVLLKISVSDSLLPPQKRKDVSKSLQPLALPRALHRITHIWRGATDQEPWAGAGNV
jgi:hypothetical protein